MAGRQTQSPAASGAITGADGASGSGSLEQKPAFELEHSAPIRRQVYERLRDDIVSGVIVPGQRLVETSLAENLGVSRTPIREALHLLESEGLLEAIPRVGYHVRGISPDEVEELYALRLAIESLIIHWASRRMTPEDLQALQQNVEQCEARLPHGETEEFALLYSEFHDILARASHAPRTAQFTEILRHYMRRVRKESLFLSGTVQLALSGHKQILERLEAGDEYGAVEALERHLLNSKQSVQFYLFNLGEAPKSPAETRGDVGARG